MAWLASGAAAQAAGAAVHCPDPAAGLVSHSDFFTNFGRYMPRTHCMLTEQGETDWPWVIGLVLATAGVIAAYLRIFVFWIRCYRAEAPNDRVTKLMDLAWIFLWCAVCGYLMSIVMFVWPAYRLLVLFLLVLNWWSWKFCLDLSGFSISFSAKRLQRELREHLETRNAELERLVELRTHELDRERRLVQEANQAKTDFLANMSHEIRTPMTAILGFTENLIDAGEVNPAQTAQLQIIHRNGQHLLHLINDILDLSKIEAGQLRLDPQVCAPLEIAREVLNLFDGRARGRGIGLHLAVAGGPPERLVTDGFRLRQILINLVGNALKFTEHGCVTVRVRAGGGEAGGTIRFEVVDTGIGIPPEAVARLFQAFSQADASTTRRFGGTGLGLSISRRLAEAMGGSLHLQSSTAGAGSTFILTLPARAATNEPPAMFMPELAGHATRGAPDRLSGRVLLAEDGPDNQRLIHAVLTRAGIDLVIVGDGRQAVDEVLRAAARGEPYPLILMDVQMPVLDGCAATAELRAAGYTGVIIALTANAMQGDRERCLAAGCDDFETKPIDRARLISKVAAALSAGRPAGAGIVSAALEPPQGG